MNLNTARLMVAGLLAGAAASAAAATDDVGGPGPGLIILFYMQAAAVLMLLPAIYIFLRRGFSFEKKLKWFLALAALDIGACVLLFLAFNEWGLNDGIFNPICWLAILVPGYFLASKYQLAVEKQARGNDLAS